MPYDPREVARASYMAYVNKDRAAIETLIADNFHFTSPLDNRIDRATYFARCWPNSSTIDEFKFIHIVQDRDRVFVTYEGRNKSRKRFRNSEILTVHDGKIVEAEVYFGWTISHEAPSGSFINPDKSREIVSRRSSRRLSNLEAMLRAPWKHCHGTSWFPGEDERLGSL